MPHDRSPWMVSHRGVTPSHPSPLEGEGEGGGALHRISAAPLGPTDTAALVQIAHNAYTACMGHIYATVTVGASRSTRARMLVDTGATFSVIPPSLARRIGLGKPRRRVPVALADGRMVRLPADVAVFRIDGREAGGTVVIAQTDVPLLGVETLDALGLKVDPVRERLYVSRPFAVRLGGFRKPS